MKAVLLSLITIVIISCGVKFEGYSEKPSGLLFKLETIEDGEKRIQKNNYLQFKYAFKNYKGEELDASRLLLKVNDVYESGGLLEALSLVNEKELASAIFPVSKLREELDGAFQLGTLNDTSLLFSEIQIDSIYTEEEFLSARKKFIDWLNVAETKDFDVLREEVAVENFVRQNGFKTEQTISGLRYLFVQRGKGEEAGYGKRVQLKYEGRFFNGEIFNSTNKLENGVQSFYLGQEMQVVKAIEEALLFMREGDVVLLFVPSWIGFGVNGSSTRIVPPHTPVLFEVELNKVN